MTEMAEALRQNCEQALSTGLKFQEEAGRWWSSVLNPATCAQQWQQQFNSATRTANSFIPLAQKPVNDLVELAEKNARLSADLMKKAFDAAQAPVLDESQAKWKEFWTSSLDAARSNAEALSLISSKALDSWSDYISKGA
jgi:hypothetical protein